MSLAPYLLFPCNIGLVPLPKNFLHLEGPFFMFLKTSRRDDSDASRREENGQLSTFDPFRTPRREDHDLSRRENPTDAGY